MAEGAAGDGPGTGDLGIDGLGAGDLGTDGLGTEAFTSETVAALLAAQGYRVPASDLEEIALRLQALVEGLMAYDVHQPFDAEPWSEWPRAAADA